MLPSELVEHFWAEASAKVGILLAFFSTESISLVFERLSEAEEVEVAEAARLVDPLLEVPWLLLPFVIESLEPLIESPTLCIPLSSRKGNYYSGKILSIKIFMVQYSTFDHIL